MSSPTSSPLHSGMRPYSWQERLQGGRTAWSSTVTIEGQSIAARYWYDGQYVNNAKEDAAEVALQQLRVVPTPTSPVGSRRQFPVASD
ncbi:MAG: hypothetical protein M1833_004445 [Piccolia ochrophora]|nr:MAG: hypothetical protein M1833_004445 [Piccolia ochrophora]